MIKYLEDIKILSKNQFGFILGIGTEDALNSTTKIFDFILLSLDKSKKTKAIFIDLAKVFDTVDHVELIKILPSFRIKVNSLKWINSYLTDRQQIVKVNKVLGRKRKIVCGVPQGSVLGPLFFILRINSICDLVIDGRIVTYLRR